MTVVIATRRALGMATIEEERGGDWRGDGVADLAGLVGSGADVLAEGLTR